MRQNKFGLTSRLLVALLFLFGGLGMQAQYDNGSLLGTIRDASGASIAGATVTVTNTATGQVSTVTTNASGDYDVPSLHVGVYTVTVSDAGYADAVAKDITVWVDARISTFS
jgi:hypothetical protein